MIYSNDFRDLVIQGASHPTNIEVWGPFLKDQRLLPSRSPNHYMKIFSNYLGDLNLIPWNSYLTFIPLKFETGPQVWNLNPRSYSFISETYWTKGIKKEKFCFYAIL